MGTGNIPLPQLAPLSSLVASTSLAPQPLFPKRGHEKGIEEELILLDF